MEQKPMHSCDNSRVINDNVVLKKMRQIRKLSRNEAALIFEYSRSSIEKIENGRAKLTQDRICKFVQGYGFSMQAFMDMKFGKSDIFPERSVQKVKIIEHKELRRSYQKIVTKEVVALIVLRRRLGFSQYKAAKLCGYAKSQIGHIENGRVDLTPARIKHILTSYGYTMKEFEAQLKSDIDRLKLEHECTQIIKQMDDQKIKAVHPFLKNFA